MLFPVARLCVWEANSVLHLNLTDRSQVMFFFFKLVNHRGIQIIALFLGVLWHREHKHQPASRDISPDQYGTDLSALKFRLQIQLKESFWNKIVGSMNWIHQRVLSIEVGSHVVVI